MQNTISTLHSEFLKNLSIAAFNPMQISVIEKAETAHNLIVLSPTGSGKTLAFLISIINKLSSTAEGVQALIVAPSRELALQIEDVFRNMKTSYKVSCCYGGHAFNIEKNSLSEAPAIIIGTPGRLADHIGRGSFDASYIKAVVLDEFDKSLQMGFHKQLEIIFKSLNGKQTHLLTSATNIESLPEFLPFKKIETLDYLSDKVTSKLKLKIVHTKSADKVDSLLKLVSSFNQEVCLVFCNHREAVERISSLFKLYKFEHGIFHGGMEQIDREKSLIKFRGGAHNVLITTDLAARGLDIPEIKHIVHYQLPPQEDSYTHRNGRTARMHAEGSAYLILADDETLPEYIGRENEKLQLKTELLLPAPPSFSCLYISAGKKDKINKGDIAGLLMKKGGLQVQEIGLITTLDHSSYVAVKRSKVDKLLSDIKNERLKKTKVKIEIAS